MDAARDYELIYVQGRIWGASSSASAFFDQSPEGDVWFEPVCHPAHVSGAFTDYKIASRPNHAAEENRNLNGRKYLQFQQGFMQVLEDDVSKLNGPG
jgi:mannose-6-phosphate isomerase class I